jgi:hypothetical protein
MKLLHDDGPLLGDGALVTADELLEQRLRVVGDGALYVEGAGIITEDRPPIRVGLLDGRAGVADERRIQQGITQVAWSAEGLLTR